MKNLTEEQLKKRIARYDLFVDIGMLLAISLTILFVIVSCAHLVGFIN